MAFKSNDRTFEKVYGIFDKKDYFNAKGLAKTQIGNFERALQRNDKGAQQILDKFKGDIDKSKEYITQVISDQKKEQAYGNYMELQQALADVMFEPSDSKVKAGVDFIKRRVHNNSQKYTMALYSALRKKKFTNYKDVHNDVDSFIGESVNEGKKRYYQQDGIGKAKYTISYHDGKKKHKDGSDFFDIQTFRNKKDLAKFVNTLHKGGYKYGFDESVKESSKYRHLYYTNEAKTKESKIIQKIHTYTKTERKFYDELAKHEVRIGQRDYAKFIINALRGFGINPREFKRIPDAEEKLYQTVSKND
jgi:hypothetical protein